MSAKSRSTLATELTTAVNDNTSGDITPADVRGVITDANDSAVNKTDEVSAFMMTVLDDPDQATVRSTLGLGNSATRNVGTTAGTVSAGDDTRITGAVPQTRTVTAGTGLTGGGDLTANRVFDVTFGTTAGTSCQGNDARLSDERTPTSHTHAQSEITNLVSDLAAKAPLASPALTGTPTVPDDPYDATSWNGSSGIPTKNAIRDKFESLSGGFDPFDRSVFVIVEDFPNSASGTHGWGSRAIGSGPTGTHGSGLPDYPGVHEIRTGTTIGSGIRLELGTSGAAINYVTVDGSRAFEYQCVFRFTTALTGARARIGFTATAAAQPTDGVWLRYDVNSGFGDTTFKLAARTGSGTETTQDTGVTPTLNTWYRVRIWSTGDNVVRCTVNSSSEVSVSSGLPTAACNISNILCTDAAAEQRLQTDWIAFRATGLTR